MKILRTILSLILFAQVHAQILPDGSYIGTPTINPNPAYSTDQVQIITFYTTPELTYPVNASFTLDIVTKKIKLQRCFYVPPNSATISQFFTDTFNIGQLAPGTYSVMFDCVRSSSYQPCVPAAKDSLVFTFTVTDNPTGLKNQIADLSKIKIFPNPIKDKLNLEFSNTVVDVRISILNTLGQSFYELNNVDIKQEIDLGPFAKGIYFLKVQNDEGQKIFKIIKE